MQARPSIRHGLITFGVIGFLIIIGIPQTAGDFLWPLLALITFLMGGLSARREYGDLRPWREALVNGLLTGLIAGAGTGLITYTFASLMAAGVNVQSVLYKVVPVNMAALARTSAGSITSGAPIVGALVMLALLMTGASLLGALLTRLYSLYNSRRKREVEFPVWRKAANRWAAIASPFLLFGAVLAFDIPGLRIGSSQSEESIIRLLVVFVTISAGLFAIRSTREGTERLIVGAMVGVLIFILPQFLDQFQHSVMNAVAIYVMLGLGLNVVVGYAGLLDLGYVAFFAIGAYVYGMLASPTSIVLTSSPGFSGLSFWLAIPLAIIAATLAGILLGIPVLRMRGDYLAIVTLGFGEIIRLLLLNLRHITNGPGGLHDLPPPMVFGLDLGSPKGILYLALIGSAIIIIVTTRLNNSRLGRAWIAMREDEDVAEAMGINLVFNKLQAFAFGAAFAGLGGLLFATRQVNIFPGDFTLFVSIDILSLIIIGGIGSIEGIILGSIALIGLPEVLRGVDEYRILAFGALLVAMMIVRPEGLLPSARRQQELHHDQEPVLSAEGPAGDYR